MTHRCFTEANEATKVLSLLTSLASVPGEAQALVHSTYGAHESAGALSAWGGNP
jgi:hypothetical protein